MNRGPHRGFVIVAVLIAGIGGLWVATSLLFIMSADTRAGVASRSLIQQRARLVSGVRLISEVLGNQRETILAGQRPRLEPQYVLWDVGNREAVVRLLPVDAAGGILVPEASRLDINHASADMLAEVPGMNLATATAVVALRNQRTSGRLFSLYELLEVDSVGIRELLGSSVSERSMDIARGELGDVGDRIEQRLARPIPRGLIDLLTVHGFEPNLQWSGRRRINLDVPWSEELRLRIEERFDEDIAAVLASLFEANAFTEEQDIVRTLRRLEVPVTDWDQPLDAFTTREGIHVAGRVDLNSAPVEVLQTLPGIDPTVAEQIVARRDLLDDDERRSIIWPLRQGLVSESEFEASVPFLTNRSWTWRLRLAVGLVDPSDPDGPLDRPVIFEVVIDLADPNPRIGYLRDITMLQTSTELASLLATEPDDAAGMPPPLTPGSESVAVAADANPPLNPLEWSEEPIDSPAMNASSGPARIGRWLP